MEKPKKHLCLPAVNSKYYDRTKAVSVEDKSEKEACPCCGYLTIPKGTDENMFSMAFICPVCFWEIDTFISNENEKSDQNGGLTLWQARINYKIFGACDKQMLKYVRKPTDDEKKEE